MNIYRGYEYDNRIDGWFVVLNGVELASNLMDDEAAMGFIDKHRRGIL